MIRLKEVLGLIDYLNENSKSTYEYGCAMLYFSFPEMAKIQELIDKNDVYTRAGDKTYGLEDEPHTTLLYGLHKEVSVDEVEDVFDDYTFYTCKVHKPSLFQNDSYDVLKFEVEGDPLQNINKDFRKFPHTNDYPDYNPHLTIGYLRAGRGQKYVDILNEKGYNEYWLAPQYGIYSQPDGTKNKITIMVD